MPRNEHREYRSMPVMAARAAAEGAAPDYHVTGYASTFSEPYSIGLNPFTGEEQYEVIEPGAFDACDMTDVIFQFDHAGRVFARTKNGTMDIGVDDHGLKTDADLSTTANARNMYEDIAAGLIDEMSFSFIIAEQYYEEAKRLWHVTAISKLFDVSAVSIPANPGTEISAEKRMAMAGVSRSHLPERADTQKRAAQILRAKIKISKVRNLS